MDNRIGKMILCGTESTSYSAFLPNFISGKNLVQYDDEMIWLLSEANRYIGRLDEITDSLISPSYFVYMYACKEATLSSQIEGTQATFSDLLKSEAGLLDEVPNDVEEIRNYIKALEYGRERLKEFPLSLRLIKEIHFILMQGVRGKDKRPGEFRKSQNWIGGYSINTATYVPPPIEMLDSLLNDFEKFLHQKDKMPLLIKTAIIHSYFEMIHPFLDGNGRIGRLLITFYLECNNIIHQPTLYLSSYIKRNRDDYYKYLNNVRLDSDLESWIKFFLQGVIETSKEAVNISRKIVEIRENDIRIINNMGHIAKHAMLIYEGLFDKPTININYVAEKANVSISTAGRIINKMEERGILEKLDERKRNKTLIYKKYTNLFAE